MARDEVVLMATQTGSIDFKSTKGFQSYASGQYATLTQVKGQFATCSTAAGTQAKAATNVPSDTGWELYTGATITVKFTADNTHATPTLNVNSTGAKSIRDHTGAALTEEAYKWKAGDALAFTYDGTYWRMQDTLAQRVTTNKTAIEQNASDILLRATKTEAAQMAQPNLSPYFSSSPYDRTANSYWYGMGVNSNYTFTDMGDGWMRVQCTNSGSSVIRVDWYPIKCPSVVAGQPYTWLAEVRNNASTSANSGSDFYLVQNNNCQFWGQKAIETIEGPSGAGMSINIGTCGSSYVMQKVQNAETASDGHWTNNDEASVVGLACWTFRCAANSSIDYEVRLSLYSGRYAGPYKPYVGSQLYASQAELKVTADGITSTVSSIASAKYVDAKTASWPLASLKTYAAEGHSENWDVTSTDGLRVGDTVYVKGTDGTRNCTVYIKTTVTAVNSATNFTGTSHGYEDVLPVDTVKSTINQSSDSVKIEARHVDIVGAAIFTTGRLSESSLNNAYDAKGAAAGLVAGGENLIGNFDFKLKNNADYDYLTGTLTSVTTTNTRDNGVYIQFYTGTTASSTGTFVRQLDVLGNSSNVGQLIHATFEKASDFTHFRVKFNGDKADAGVFWDISFISDGTQLTFSCTLDSISSDGKGNGGVLSGINLRTGNMPSRWSLAPQDIPTKIGGRNYAKTRFELFPVGKSETRKSGVTATIIGPSTFTLNGSATTTDWFFSAAYVFGGLTLQVGTYKVWYTSPNVNVRVGVGSAGNTWFAAGTHCTKDNPFTLEITTEQAYYFTPYASVGDSYSNQEVRLMVECGDKPTDWSPAPEDVAASAVKRTQRIWYRKEVAGAPATPSSWVVKPDDGTNAWTKMHVSITETEKFIYTCEQYEMGDGTVGYTSVLLDNTITVIDGGNVITGSVTATQIAAGTITGEQIAADTIEGGNIKGNAITAEHLSAAFSLDLGKVEGLNERLESIEGGISRLQDNTQWVHYDQTAGTVFGESGSANNVTVKGSGIDFNTDEGRAAWATGGVFHANEMEAETIDTQTITMGDWAIVQSGSSFYIDYIGS